MSSYHEQFYFLQKISTCFLTSLLSQQIINFADFYKKIRIKKYIIK
jgi:hypothetical protein